MTKKEKVLRETYDNESIDIIEGVAAKSCQEAKRSRSVFIDILSYLQFTSRYKENKLYKNATFYTYIYDQFHIRQHTYLLEKKAFFQFPKETINLGVGIVTKSIKKCGMMKTKKVLQEIEKLPKKTPEKIERVIRLHSKPEKPRKEKTNTTFFNNMLKRKDDKIETIVKESESLSEQIARLKLTVADKNVEINKLKLQVKEYKKKYEGLREIANLFNNHADVGKADVVAMA